MASIAPQALRQGTWARGIRSCGTTRENRPGVWLVERNENAVMHEDIFESAATSFGAMPFSMKQQFLRRAQQILDNEFEQHAVMSTIISLVPGATFTMNGTPCLVRTCDKATVVSPGGVEYTTPETIGVLTSINFHQLFAAYIDGNVIFDNPRHPAFRGFEGYSH